MGRVKEVRKKLSRYVAPNYSPLPFVPLFARGEWIQALVEEKNGRNGFRALLDLHSTYSAAGFGHNHPDIVALKIKRLQEARPALIARGLGMIQELAELAKKLSEVCGTEMMIPKNTGAEGFETAVKVARRWGYWVKGIEDDKAEVIVCGDADYSNFHGRTAAAVQASTDPAVREGFGPFGPERAFVKIPFGDIEALKTAITPYTAAFITEPIQAEAGVVLPPHGYLVEARQICKNEHVLLILDEVQTGLGRTGKMFAWQHDGEGARPDGIILGKFLGGDSNIISVLALTREALKVLTPGSEGSTFGGNPEACAVAAKTLELLCSDPTLLERVSVLGERFMEELRSIRSPFLKEVRGRGLLNALELTPAYGGSGRFQKALFEEGVLCIKRHENVVGFSPPLNIGEHNLLKYAVSKIKKVLKEK